MPDKKFPKLELLDTGPVDEGVGLLRDMLKKANALDAGGSFWKQERNERESMLAWRLERHLAWAEQEFSRGWTACEEGAYCGGTESESWLAGYSESYAWQEMGSFDPDEKPEDMG